MTLELASERVVRKPWGKTDLRPWSELGHDGAAIGEVWFQRADREAPEPSLLLKLLFTDEALSIQVHPDDAFAHAVGLPRGKTEAWYILAAEPGAQLSLGLKRPLAPPQLRRAILDRSIVDLVQNEQVSAGQAFLVPAGTIHAIGAGLVVAEIQQRGDATFRMFDYGRDRDLHLDAAVAAATAGPAVAQVEPERLSDARLVLAKSQYFVLELLDLPANSYWEINADREAWMLLLEGSAAFDILQVVAGEAVFVADQRAGLRAGGVSVKALFAYVASEPVAGVLLSRNGEAPQAAPNRFPGIGKVRELRPGPLPQGRVIRS
jgi:mannose-6-phosphate isomerase